MDSWGVSKKPAMLCTFYQHTSDDEIEDIQKSIITSIADTMRMLVTESTYGVVNGYDQRIGTLLAIFPTYLPSQRVLGLCRTYIDHGWA
eukprot:14524012-Ditylum_brightwellii.AAC.1